jgi:hypothetical protein
MIAGAYERWERPSKRPCNPRTKGDSIPDSYPFAGVESSGKSFFRSRIRRLKSQRTSIVPPIPINVIVHPNVQRSIDFSFSLASEARVFGA